MSIISFYSVFRSSLQYIDILLVIDSLYDFVIHGPRLAFPILELIYLLLQLINLLFIQCDLL